MPEYALGLDIGSISVNTVLIDSEGNVAEDHYTQCHGRPFHALYDVLSNILDRHTRKAINSVAITGTGGKLASQLIGGNFVNEIVAQSAAVAAFHPEAKTVIEMGGEDSKLIIMDSEQGTLAAKLSDFAMNTVCAAGTGSFLDQQAKRIGISIEEEFGYLALQSENPPHIAGRCSVFAKSDMIHLQQIATPVQDIVAGLCFAVARNVRSNLARGRDLERPVIFQGGVAANVGVARAFREVLNLIDGDLIIPAYHASMGAIGASIHTRKNPPETDQPFKGLSELREHLKGTNADLPHWGQLEPSQASGHKDIKIIDDSTDQVEVFLGLDVGSLSTNVVLIDDDTNVVARRYLPTASKPLEAIRRGLSEIFDDVGEKVVVKGAGTTGSGRYLTGHFVGADTIKNEITAQATASVFYDPEVDTVFEIGGQDSKFISIDNGVVVDFEMNKVCAAGTGSFLEEQAEKLGISIVEEFGSMALGAKQPSLLGNRCTVFMESDLNSQQQKGANKEDLIGGLAYSIVQNYIQKVVGTKRIGDHILFQGGVTNNPAVVAAFEKVTGKKINVPPHFDVTGAIGAAMLAREHVHGNGNQTNFKGFKVSKVPYAVSRFTCGGCENHCDVHKVVIEGEKRALFYGDRCDKYQPNSVKEVKETRRREIPDLFEERERLLLGDFQEEPPSEDRAAKATIGIPRGLMLYYQRFPYWRTFFEKLGFRVVLSRASDTDLVTQSLSMLVAETCFPVEVVHGHIQDLIDKDTDYIFMPFVVDNSADDENPTVNYNCPWIQAYPYMIRGTMKDDDVARKFLIPTLHFRYSKKKLVNDLTDFMRDTFGSTKTEVAAAVKAAEIAQIGFENELMERGRKILSNLPPDRVAVVLLGRPYNTGDPELNLSVVTKLIDLGVLPIPLDFLPLDETMGEIYSEYNMMYWTNGRKILAGATMVAKDPRLNAVYITNFRCGPDSFISHFVRKVMKDKPYLQLEVDEHRADAGMMTRCEAFLDSLTPYAATEQVDKKTPPVAIFRASPSPDRTLYIPYQSDAVYMIAAASRACGIDAHVTPMQDKEDLEWGRKYTSSRECFPFICALGSVLKKLHEPGIDPSKVGFFIPSHNGPCRFGLYHKLMRQILEDMGLGDAEIVSPSNKTSYADYSQGQGVKFRLYAWKGLVAADILGKMRQERKPYEAIPGQTEKTYQEQLSKLIQSVETGAKNVIGVLKAAGVAFQNLEMINMPRKPIVALVGEIFMRDNAYCSGYLKERLENLGAETSLAAPREWIELASVRYRQESGWRGETLKTAKAMLQGFFQRQIGLKYKHAVADVIEVERMPEVEEILDHAAAYIHRDYVGDPPMALGIASAFAETGISGVAATLPFTCLPGTIVSSLSTAFRKDHDDMPWVNIAYDGQEDTGIETRLQAFVHQAREYSRRKGYDKPRVW
ncbi:MAG: CoA activase [Spirochaetales bacterium]|nr:CoA activase [Spirochaetales bacterium]